MAEKIKTGLCAALLALSLLAAWAQESSLETAGKTAVQPAPFAAMQTIN